MDKEVKMAIMTRWDTFQDLRGAQNWVNQMNRIFAATRGQAASQSGVGVTSTPAWAPAVDIFERKDAYLVTVELPGVKIDDLEISFQDGLLTIQGERRLAQDSPPQQFHMRERRYGLFRRSIALPLQVRADAIRASAEDGVLQVVVPKVEETKSTRIEVYAGPAQVPAAAATAGAQDSTPS
jgi:HSP20 family protein